MNKLPLVLALIIAVCGSKSMALTFETGIEKEESAKKRSFLAHLVRPEGRIGVRVKSSSGQIEYVHRGSPAATAGLLKDDTVVEVDGRKHSVTRISGEPGTRVHLLIRRGSDEFEKDVARVDYHDFID